MPTQDAHTSNVPVPTPVIERPLAYTLGKNNCRTIIFSSLACIYMSMYTKLRKYHYHQ